MAITIGTITPDTGLAGGSDTFSHDNNGDYLVVGVSSIIADVDGTPDTVTYNGTSMTKIGDTGYSLDCGATLWELIAPDSGAHDVVVTWTGDTTVARSMGAISFSGVHQTTPSGTVATATSNSTTAPSVTATTASGEVVVDCHAFYMPGGSATAATADANQTERVDTGQSTTRRIGMSTQDGADGGVMSWTLDQTCRTRSIAVSIKPAAAGTNTSVKRLIGGGVLTSGLTA